jgi:ABC-type branched-subunit amino acid transport system ATPase component
MLELRLVNTNYGGIRALRDVSLFIEQGEIVTLIGANGAGKSTTLMSICGVRPPRSGEILFYGLCPSIASPRTGSWRSASARSRRAGTSSRS